MSTSGISAGGEECIGEAKGVKSQIKSDARVYVGSDDQIRVYNRGV